MLSSLRQWSSPRRFCVRLASTARRGQNLTERYRRLENATRTKSQLSPLTQSSGSARSSRTSTDPDIIAGFVIPQEPRAPADDECCMSGCAVCVYDLYEEALGTYKESVTSLRAALSARHIPETEWPAHIRTDSKAATTAKGVVLDAFEEMERTLKEKRDARATVEAEKRARGDGERVAMGLDLWGVYEAVRWLVFPNR